MEEPGHRARADARTSERTVRSGVFAHFLTACLIRWRCRSSSFADESTVTLNEQGDASTSQVQQARRPEASLQTVLESVAGSHSHRQHSQDAHPERRHGARARTAGQTEHQSTKRETTKFKSVITYHQPALK